MHSLEVAHDDFHSETLETTEFYLLPRSCSPDVPPIRSPLVQISRLDEQPPESFDLRLLRPPNDNTVDGLVPDTVKPNGCATWRVLARVRDGVKRERQLRLLSLSKLTPSSSDRPHAECDEHRHSREAAADGSDRYTSSDGSCGSRSPGNSVLNPAVGIRLLRSVGDVGLQLEVLPELCGLILGVGEICEVRRVARRVRRSVQGREGRLRRGR